MDVGGGGAIFDTSVQTAELDMGVDTRGRDTLGDATCP